MYPAGYDFLIRSRQETLLREAERERLIAAARQQGTVEASFRPWTVRLGCSLLKWGRKLEHFGLAGKARA